MPKRCFFRKLIDVSGDNLLDLDKLRSELYQLAAKKPDCPQGYLIKRVNPRRCEKLAADCYVLHMFLCGETSGISSIFRGSRSLSSDSLSQDMCSNDLASTISTLTMHVNCLVEIVDGIEQRLTDNQNSLIQEIKSRDSRIEDLLMDLSAHSGRLDTLQKEMREMATISDQGLARLDSIYRERLDVQMKSVNVLQKEVTSLNIEVDAIRDISDKLQFDLNGFKESLEHYASEMLNSSAIHMAENENCSSDIKQIKQDIKNIESNSAEYKEKVHSCVNSVMLIKYETLKLDRQVNNITRSSSYASVLAGCNNAEMKVL